MFHRERAVQAHGEYTHLLAVFLHQNAGGFLGHFGAGGHHHDHTFGIGGTHILKQLVLAANNFGELVHVLLHDCRAGFVVGVHGFAALEVHIGVLSGSAHHRAIRGQTAGAMFQHQIFIHHGQHVFIVDQFDFVDFV